MGVLNVVGKATLDVKDVSFAAGAGASTVNIPVLRYASYAFVEPLLLTQTCKALLPAGGNHEYVLFELYGCATIHPVAVLNLTN